MFEIFKKLLGISSHEQIKEAMINDAFLVDVRTPSEFAAGSVNNAINIPFDKIEIQLALFNGKKNIVVFCKSGGRSGMAKRLLNKNGFSNVINGGTWQNVANITVKH